MDIYDNMLNSIQQFPLDANYFERRIKRAKKRHSYCLAKFRKILRQIPNHDADAYMRVQKRLARCIKQKIKIIKKFMRCLGTQIGNLEESDKLSGCLLNIKKLAPDGCSLVRIKEEVPLASRVCACKTNDGGLLICCDAPDCTVRWYHYKCMGLSAVPTGRWYCEKCRKAAHPSD
ncbi:hypothetical protein PAPHI01_2390 [Pancytospora philotis]|nr:hypothetical protein PAPHI01_2390 [Pancytospora philotis]